MDCKKYLIIYFMLSFNCLIGGSISGQNGDEDVSQDIWHDPYFESWGWFGGQKEEEIKENKQKTHLNPFSAENIAGLEAKLKQRLVGQNHAIKLTVAALERYAQGFHNPNAPIASLLYVGPTGVGKTQLAKELVKILFGSEEYLLRLNMSEFSQYNSVLRLIGSPPGYADHQAGGQFTELLKQHPYSIILLDEVEKAHPYVLKTFLQLFEEGFISDSKGHLIDCRNCLFILTTNLTGSKILTMHDLGHTDREILTVIQPTLIHDLSPELYNRLETVIFRGLKENILDDLIEHLLLDALAEITSRKNIQIKFDVSIVQFLKNKATNYLLGARPIKQLINQTVMTAIVDAFKENYFGENESIKLSYTDGCFVISGSAPKKPFEWKWNDEEQSNKQVPFKLQQVLQLGHQLKQRVLGQPYAIDMTVAALTRYAAGLGNSTAPIGAFLYVGPTGVGKTQLAKELTRELLGSENHLIRLDMSEYSEPHSISRLIGSPPGYINHDEGGQLTEALKKHPYAVVLLDEIEKAHPIVLKTFLQVFDEGRLSDAQGSVIDCRNVIFILTTNLTSQTILTMHAAGYQEEEILEVIQHDITKFLSPELYNRLEVAPFIGLSQEHFEQLIWNMLKEVQKELHLKKQITVEFDASLVAFLQVNGFDYELGARPLKRLIQQTVVTSIAKEIIAGHIQSGEFIKIFYYNGAIFIEKIEK